MLTRKPSDGQAPKEDFKDCEGQRQAMAGGAGVGVEI